MTDQPSGSGFSTMAIHAGAHLGLAPMPGALAPTFVADDIEVFGGAGHGSASHPTYAVLEERIAALEGGSAALAVGSGRAAQLLVFHTLLQPGDEFVAARGLHDGSVDQFDHAFRSFGWAVKWADADRPESFVEALSDKTKALFVESIAHPGGQVTDIEAIATVARRARLPLVVDNTLATPYLMRPFDHGADIVVHSATRFLGGHGTSGGGIIVDGGIFDWAGDARYPLLSKPQPSHGGHVIGETYGNYAFATACRVLGLRDLGPALSPFDAFLILNGIATLPLRMQRHCDNALAVAQHLSRHHAVEWVRYAGLDDDPGHALARRYCPRGAGAVFTFGLAGGHEAGEALVGRLKLFSPLADAGDTRSLAIHPASHRQSGNESGGEGVRVSIGLEDASDIIADLDQALAG